ncbi:MAG: hypothetical protein ACFFCX_00680 [Candidatus Sifarchaeia archaeon]
MQTPYSEFAQSIVNLFIPISDFFQSLGLPFGPIAWMFIIGVTPLLLIIVLLVVRGRRASGSAGVDEAIRKVIASTGDVSGGLSGAKRLKFLKTPAQALVYLKIEENAIQQALSAVDYYNKQGDIDEAVKDKLATVYQDRLKTLRAALAKDEQLKEIVDTSSAVDRARSDYLAKLAAMSGTAVEDDTGEAGPSSVGMPSKVSTGPPTGPAPTAGPPGGGPPGGGPPGGGPPSGGPPGGAPPSDSPPDRVPPSDIPPTSAEPSGGPSAGPAPTAGPPSGGPPGGATIDDSPKPASGKSSLQSEMLAEMERLKALMGGD